MSGNRTVEIRTIILLSRRSAMSANSHARHRVAVVEPRESLFATLIGHLTLRLISVRCQKRSDPSRTPIDRYGLAEPAAQVFRPKAVGQLAIYTPLNTKKARQRGEPLKRRGDESRANKSKDRLTLTP
ncbi:hypothetical protein [Burkholderia glumae]|uniref:hypothetical protein n=1 Tax=Burkholderia glumae TaxID=337 RepID=UPI0014644D10|nr:hypothetical protein [Burkholderia glumae]QJP71752.1 hypothetical protein HJC54_16230 [Burkholderia glumae]